MNGMKAVFAIILISCIAGVTIFGFLGFEAGHQNNLGCFAGTPCPVQDGMFAFALFHFQALKGSIANAFAPVSLFVLSLILFVAFALTRSRGQEVSEMRRVCIASALCYVIPAEVRRESWLAFHTHSPSIL